MPLPFQQPGDGVADDGAAQVADVHLLGHVGRRVVDHHGLGRRRERYPEACVVAHGRDLAGQVFGAQDDVEKAGARHLDRRDHVVREQFGRDLRRHVTRLSAQLAAERHREIRLVVGVLRAVKRGIGGRGVVAEGSARGRLDAEAEGNHRIDHGHGAGNITPIHRWRTRTAMIAADTCELDVDFGGQSIHTTLGRDSSQ